MYKIHVYQFYTNNPELKLEDIITDLKIGYDKGVYCVHLKTVDKYVRIDAGGSLYSPDCRGTIIEISPYIYNELGVDLHDANFDGYLEHKDYYRIRLVLEVENHLQATVIPLKHEYFVSFIQNDLVMNYDCLKEADITVWED